MSLHSPVRFALIGFGLFGQHHADAIIRNRKATLDGIAVNSFSSAHLAKEEYPEAYVELNYREVIGSDIDVVDIVVPNHLHFEIAKYALEEGKHILLEKPMALSVQECDELLEIAASHQLKIAINHELRLSSLWKGIRNLIDEGKIGDPLHVLIELSRFPYRPGSGSWRYDYDCVGSWILEEPIHFFDLARWYLSDVGEPVSIYARANGRDKDHPELKDNFSAIVDFPENVYAVVSQTLSAFGHHVSAKITGTDGGISAFWSAPDARSDHPSFGLSWGLGNDVHEMSFDRSTGELLELADQIEAVIDMVQNDTPPPCSGEDGRASTLLCLAAEESVASGKVIPLDSFK